MKIAIANDHGGTQLKKAIVKHFKSNYELIDLGTDGEKSVDYPDYAKEIGKMVSSKQIDLGILICRTGIGMSIACNKVPGAYCAKINSQKEATLSRQHNNANVIAIAGTMKPEKTIKIIEKFINTPFSNDERHLRRINKI